MRLNLYQSGPMSCLVLAIGVTAINISGVPNDLSQTDSSYLHDGQYMDQNLHLLNKTYGNAYQVPSISPYAADYSESDSDSGSDSDYDDHVDPVVSPVSLGGRMAVPPGIAVSPGMPISPGISVSPVDGHFLNGLKAKVQASLWDHYARTQMENDDYAHALMPLQAASSINRSPIPQIRRRSVNPHSCNSSHGHSSCHRKDDKADHILQKAKIKAKKEKAKGKAALEAAKAAEEKKKEVQKTQEGEQKKIDEARKDADKKVEDSHKDFENMKASNACGCSADKSKDGCQDPVLQTLAADLAGLKEAVKGLSTTKKDGKEGESCGSTDDLKKQTEKAEDEAKKAKDEKAKEVKKEADKAEEEKKTKEAKLEAEKKAEEIEKAKAEAVEKCKADRKAKHKAHKEAKKIAAEMEDSDEEEGDG